MAAPPAHKLKGQLQRDELLQWLIAHRGWWPAREVAEITGKSASMVQHHLETLVRQGRVERRFLASYATRLVYRGMDQEAKEQYWLSQGPKAIHAEMERIGQDALNKSQRLKEKSA